MEVGHQSYPENCFLLEMNFSRLLSVVNRAHIILQEEGVHDVTGGVGGRGSNEG